MKVFQLCILAVLVLCISCTSLVPVENRFTLRHSLGDRFVKKGIVEITSERKVYSTPPKMESLSLISDGRLHITGNSAAIFSLWSEGGQVQLELVQGEIKILQIPRDAELFIRVIYLDRTIIPRGRTLFNVDTSGVLVAYGTTTIDLGEVKVVLRDHEELTFATGTIKKVMFSH